MPSMSVADRSAIIAVFRVIALARHTAVDILHYLVSLWNNNQCVFGVVIQQIFFFSGDMSFSCYQASWLCKQVFWSSKRNWLPTMTNNLNIWLAKLREYLLAQNFALPAQLYRSNRMADNNQPNLYGLFSKVCKRFKRKVVYLKLNGGSLRP